MAIWNILRQFGYTLWSFGNLVAIGTVHIVLVYCGKKNLATLLQSVHEIKSKTTESAQVFQKTNLF
jgi:hypothetical protein